MAINFLQSIDLNKNELQNASLHPLGANPGTPSTGQFYFNTGDDTIRVYNGSGWVTFSGGSVTLATSSVAGIVKLFSDTDQSVAANSVSTTAGRTYGVQLNASDQMVVNVPWTDTTGAVTSVDETTPGTSTGTPIVVNPTTGNVQVQSMAYAGTTNVGHVPAGGTASTFLRGDGTWVTPTDTQPLTTEQVQDIVGTQIVTNGTHDGISVTYDDGTDGGINFTNTKVVVPKLAATFRALERWRARPDSLIWPRARGTGEALRRAIAHPSQWPWSAGASANQLVDPDQTGVPRLFLETLGQKTTP